MECFPVLDGISRLIILVDNDINDAGKKAAEACTQRWLAAGRRIARLTPPRRGSDFNDFVLERRDVVRAFKAMMERTP
jgi:putative DNA primase/helicase